MYHDRKNVMTIIISVMFVIILSFKINNVDAADMENNFEPFETVATYKMKDVSPEVLADIKTIASNDFTVSMTIKNNELILKRLYVDPDNIQPSFSLSTFSSLFNKNIRTVNFNSAIADMDSENEEASVPNGTPIGLLRYTGQTYSGERVYTGTHVHCNRFNGPMSDHRYWSHSNAKSWEDFYHSDCDYHSLRYGCKMSGLVPSFPSKGKSKCDGLNRRGKGVRDCSAWKGARGEAPHKNWPKTCWYRK